MGLAIPTELHSYSNRILIAEDEPAMANAIKRVLESGGYDTTIAKDGFQAGSILESFSPAIIVLDLMMPEMKGLDLLQYIHDDAKYSHIRVLVVSAAPQADLKKASSLGADAILEKPFDNKVLLSKVAALAVAK